MKDKKHKYLEDVIEEYIAISEEQVEIPALIEKAVAGYQDYSKQYNGTVISATEAQFAFKCYNQLKKYNERKEEIEAEVTEIEGLLKDFLQFFEGHKISYERKDDNKTKITYLFWLEDGILKFEK